MIYLKNYEQFYEDYIYTLGGEKFPNLLPILKFNFICDCGAEHSVKTKGDFPNRIRCSICKNSITKKQLEKQFAFNIK